MTECTCVPVPEHLHTTHYGAIEPGSMFEPDPDCLEHGWAIRSDAIEDRIQAAIRPVLVRADRVAREFSAPQPEGKHRADDPIPPLAGSSWHA